MMPLTISRDKTMKIVKLTVCTMCATFVLAGCAYFKTDEAGTSQKVDLTNLPPTLEQQGLDLISLTNSASQGSVQIYSLDDPEPYLREEQGGSVAVSRGVPASSSQASNVYFDSPSVQIFPLDDNMRNVIAPDLLPPSAARGNLPSPYDSEPLIDESAPQNYDSGSDQGYFSQPQASAVFDYPELDYVPAPVSSQQAAVVYFDHDSTRLGAGDKDIIRHVSEIFVPGGGQGLSVEGHASVRANYADEIQRKMVNMRISMDRALAVAKSLMEFGVPSDYIRTVAWGDTRPAAPLPGMDQEAASRRVEILAQSLQ
jgi:outer membrane protein OmpA-like peptidoglycan-associated protein